MSASVAQLTHYICLKRRPFGGEGEDGERCGEEGGGARGGQSWSLVALHSSGSRPAFVSVAGASNPAVRIGQDKMFGQACA